MPGEKRLRLQREIADLRQQLREREAALPAHSVRPHQIQAIEDLEEAVAAKEKEVAALDESH